MSDLLNIGASGVSAYRNALATIGENVVNAETKGYVRRDIRLQEAGGQSGPNPLYRYDQGALGVRSGMVVQAWDEFKASDARISTADAGRTASRSRWLAVTEAALDDGPTGTNTKLSKFFTSAQALAADPHAQAPRQSMLFALQEAAAGIRGNAQALERAAIGVSAESQGTVDVINSDLETLARLNLSIRRAGEGTAANAALAGERNRLIDDLSEKIGIDVTLASNGVATIKLAGTGQTILDGTESARFGAFTLTDGRITTTLDNVPFVAANGALAGIVAAADGIATQRTALDALANDFATELNTWSAQGVTPAGNAGVPLLQAGGGAAALVVLISSGDDIPAGLPGGAANGNLTLLEGLRGDARVESRLDLLINTQANAFASAKAEAGASAARRDASLVARDEVSGVDLDREAAELIRYQQAYDASARIIQVARETLQTILNIF